MKKLIVALALCMFFASLGMAQSSGNFSAAGNNTVCTLDKTTGALDPACGTPADGEACLSLAAPIKLSSGSGVTVLVTPSVVTGLFTQTKISTTVTTATADIGIKVCLSVDNGNTPGVQILPATADGCVVYDQRFQQISSQLFSQLTECTAYNSGVACDPLNDQCATLVGAGYTCGTTNTCIGPNPNCNFELILSTLSAHSFNFVVTMPKGPHTIHAVWKLTGVNQTSGSSSVAACTGPGDVTLTQVKVFNNSGTIAFQ